MKILGNNLPPSRRELDFEDMKATVARIEVRLAAIDAVLVERINAMIERVEMIEHHLNVLYDSGEWQSQQLVEIGEQLTSQNLSGARSES